MQSLAHTELSSRLADSPLQRSNQEWNIAMFRRDLIEAVEVALQNSGETVLSTERMREAIRSQYERFQQKLRQGHNIHQPVLAENPAPPSPTTLRRWQKHFNEGGRSLASLLPRHRWAELDVNEPEADEEAVQFAYGTTDISEQSVLFAEDYGRRYFSHGRLTKLQAHTLYKAALQYANLGRLARLEPELQVFGYRKFAYIVDNLRGFEAN